MKIIVPAMYPFPLIVFDDDTETLTIIAKLLMVIHMNGSTEALCWQMMELDKSADEMPSSIFTDAMSDALDGAVSATTRAVQHHVINWSKAVSLRPAWAKHMAAHIYEGLSK